MEEKFDKLYMDSNLEIPDSVTSNIYDFLSKFTPFELTINNKVPIFFDEKSGAYYITCHLKDIDFIQYCDLEASIDEDEEGVFYKLNRDIYFDDNAYKQMVMDASNGRSFEDLVIEYDKDYRPKKPLKIYGGQHRIKAIENAIKTGKTNIFHGLRIYFCLSKEQKVEIAIINNTSIAVSNDLIDRMREQELGSQLRNWGQLVGLLQENDDFADARNPNKLTVRIARTLIVNFYKGKKVKNFADLHQPVLCTSGGIDESYLSIRNEIDWGDPELIEMGKNFAKLHSKQYEIVSNRNENNNAEFRRKALSYAVVASWSFAAGLFSRDDTLKKRFYSLPDNVESPEDPLNAKALSEARLKGTDPDTYRGLGTRSSSKELGRMLEVFIILVIEDKRIISQRLANAAIKSYEAKKAKFDADKAIRGI